MKIKQLQWKLTSEECYRAIAGQIVYFVYKSYHYYDSDYENWNSKVVLTDEPATEPDFYDPMVDYVFYQTTKGMDVRLLTFQQHKDLCQQHFEEVVKSLVNEWVSE